VGDRGLDAKRPEQKACRQGILLLTIIRIRAFIRVMYVCLCNAVTDHDIRREAADGVHSFAELQARTGCSDCCGCCEQEARDTLDQAVQTVLARLPIVTA
jgi:bacterioferritin-associated ferredoxin